MCGNGSSFGDLKRLRTSQTAATWFSANRQIWRCLFLSSLEMKGWVSGNTGSTFDVDLGDAIYYNREIKRWPPMEVVTRRRKIGQLPMGLRKSFAAKFDRYWLTGEAAMLWIELVWKIENVWRMTSWRKTALVSVCKWRHVYWTPGRSWPITDTHNTRILHLDPACQRRFLVPVSHFWFLVESQVFEGSCKLMAL